MKSDDRFEDGRLEEARRLCDAFFPDLTARALAGEGQQARIAQAWSDRNKLDWRGLRRISMPLPAPLHASLRTELARAVRRWDTPEGRLLVTVRLAAAALLPGLRAQDAYEQEHVNQLIAAALRLPEAVEDGRLTTFMVAWQRTERWPRRPAQVYLFWPGRKAQGDRILGDYGPLLKRLAAEHSLQDGSHSLQAGPHWLNGRALSGPIYQGLRTTGKIHDRT